MSPLVTTSDAKEPTLWDRKDSEPKPPLGTDDHEIQRNSRTGADKTQQLQRYWARTLVLILVPLIVTAWYCVIWVQLVLGIETDNAVKYSTFSGSVIYYSWFIIGVFGLSWSQYGLAGVEMAMLQSRFWRAPNLVALLMHSNSTWSSPSGWLKAIYHRQFHLLWCLLTFISILPFIAFPLSGLVFEIGDGHIRTSAHPFVMGRNMTTYNGAWGPYKDVLAAWTLGSSPTISGFGVVYTPPGVDRTQNSCLEQVPNTLPLTESIPDMFLAPQADVPVSGKAWGLRVKYDCSIVRTASEFTILSEKPVSIFSSVGVPYEKERSYVALRTRLGDSIQIFNSGSNANSVNMWSYSEMGMSIPTTRAATYGSSYDVPDDISQSMVFEYALWQLQFRGYYDDKVNTTLTFDSTLGPVIEGMGSPFFMSENKTLVSNDTFFKIRGGENFTVLETGGSPATLNASITDLRDFFDPTQLTDYSQPALEVAAPIGVRCVVSSGTGMATLDGVTSTFSDFESVDPDLDNRGIGGIFGHTAQAILSGTTFLDFYAAGHLSRGQVHGGLWSYASYVSSQALLRSVLLAYGMDALYLMYGFGFEAGWVNTNLTSSRPGKILDIASLIPGHGTGYFVLVLFCIWSGTSVVLGVVYGFRKRAADKLDGYNMLIRGADMAEDLNHDGGVAAGQSFYKNGTVKALPGS
ncbi:hypothetical protein V493_03692 [Pseudogymnoascus sp. VKM F-4281 (FW-2241)]|nr:hypothetical protein V493_03692 [Pseudogymnoascus sp. VKM F-4281 (FW-2241)]